MKGAACVLALLSGPVAILLGQATIEALQHGLLFALATTLAGLMVLTNHSGRAWGIFLIVVAFFGLAAGLLVFGVVLALIAGLLALMVAAPTPPRPG